MQDLNEKTQAELSQKDAELEAAQKVKEEELRELMDRKDKEIEALCKKCEDESGEIREMKKNLARLRKLRDGWKEKETGKFPEFPSDSAFPELFSSPPPPPLPTRVW